jgi:DNA polymerase (family 10)
MPVHNADVAAALDEIADLPELEEANPFRVRAYRKAARVVGDLGRDVAGLVRMGADLTELPRIGAGLAGKIREVAETGGCALLRDLRRHTPPALARLLTVPGLGPKRVRALNRALGIRTVDQLATAARAGRVRALPGLGAKTEQNILRALASRADAAGRLSLAVAAQYAGPLAAYLRSTPGVDRVVVAGSYHRCRETVGDLDILVTAGRGSPVVDRFAAYDEVVEVLSRGTIRATARLRSGLQVDLRVEPKASYGAALHYFRERPWWPAGGGHVLLDRHL